MAGSLPKKPGLCRGAALVAVAGAALAMNCGAAQASAMVHMVGTPRTAVSSAGVGLEATAQPFPDPAEGGLAPDMTVVDVTNTPAGVVTFAISIPSQQNLLAGDQYTVYLDTDQNAGTGDAGADYALFMNGATATCGVYFWNGAAYVVATAPSLACSFNFGPSFTVSRAEAGIGAGFNLRVLATWNSGTTTYPDRAPDSGTWNYQLAFPDTSAPTVVATRGECCRRGRASLHYAVADNTNEARNRISIYDRGGLRLLNVCEYDFSLAQAYVGECAVPKRAQGKLRFCVRAFDRTGNASARHCAGVAWVNRTRARVEYSYLFAGSGSIRLTSFRVTDLDRGSKIVIRCTRVCVGRQSAAPRRDTFRSLVFEQKVLPSGSVVVVTVTTPLKLGVYQRIVVQGGRVSRINRCLLPGLTTQPYRCPR